MSISPPVSPRRSPLPPILQAWLQALLTRGRAEVNAHPSMAAVNGKNAEIFIGSQRFIKVTYLRKRPGSGAHRHGARRRPPAGTPLDRGNKEITTYLRVEVSNIVGTDPQTGCPQAQFALRHLHSADP